MRIFEALEIGEAVVAGNAFDYSVDELRQARDRIYKVGNPDDYRKFYVPIIGAIVDYRCDSCKQHIDDHLWSHFQAASLCTSGEGGEFTHK